jgi:hypothetical protein
MTQLVAHHLNDPKVPGTNLGACYSLEWLLHPSVHLSIHLSTNMLTILYLLIFNKHDFFKYYEIVQFRVVKQFYLIEF